MKHLLSCYSTELLVFKGVYVRAREKKRSCDQTFHIFIQSYEVNLINISRITQQWGKRCSTDAIIDENGVDAGQTTMTEAIGNIDASHRRKISCSLKSAMSPPMSYIASHRQYIINTLLKKSAEIWPIIGRCPLSLR